MHANRVRRKGAVSAGIVAVVLVVIIAVAGAGAYVVLGQSSAPSSSSTNTTHASESTLSGGLTSSYSTRTSSSTPTTSITRESTTSGQTATGTSTGTSSTQACLNLTSSGFNVSNQTLFNIADLFGNFTQMTIHEQIVNGSSSQNVDMSYTLVGEPVINGISYYQTNFTVSYISAQVNTSQAVSIWFLPNGTATKLTIGSTTMSSAYASLDALAFILPFTLVTELGSMFNMSEIPSSMYSVVNQSSVMLGSITVNETVYDFSSQFINMENSNCGGTSQVPFYELVLGMGKIANSGQTIAVLIYEKMNTGSSNSTMYLQVTSLTKA